MKKKPSTISFFSDIDISTRYFMRPKFAGCKLRPGQISMADNILLDGGGITVHSAPTGLGKSLAYILPALELGEKTFVLTATKALQDQLVNDFFAADLRGAQNFQCLEHRKTNCMIGGKLGCKCRGIESVTLGCPYMQQFEKALKQHMVITNYAMWFTMMNQDHSVAQQASYIVCDEAHLLVDLLTAADSASFTEQEIEWLEMNDPGADIKQWKKWAQKAKGFLDQEEKQAKQSLNIKLLEQVIHLHRKLDALTEIPSKSGEHVIDRRNGSVSISPVWPTQSFRRYFSYQKVVLTSATITKEICSFLGLKPGSYRYYEYDSEFPPENAPVYFSTGSILGYRTDPATWQRVMQKAVDIARRYVGKRGIIYTGSYERNRMFLDAMKLYDPLRPVFSHDDSRGVAGALQSFRSTNGAVLASPSITAGYDFPDDACEFIVVLKCPFPDMGSAIVDMRRRNPAYMASAMAQTLIQVCGRGVRHKDDRCDCYVLDGAAWKAYRDRPGLFPKWFRSRIVAAE